MPVPHTHYITAPQTHYITSLPLHGAFLPAAAVILALAAALAVVLTVTAARLHATAGLRAHRLP